MEQTTLSTPSPRVRLAAIARDAALAVDGVHGLDAGPAGLFVTAGAGERVAGVRCVAAPDRGFDLTLRLVCALTPLPALADRVRSVVQRAARDTGEELASVSVVIADVDVAPDRVG